MSREPVKRSEDAFGKTGVRADGDRFFKRRTKPDQARPR